MMNMPSSLSRIGNNRHCAPFFIHIYVYGASHVFNQSSYKNTTCLVIKSHTARLKSTT